MIYPPLKKLFNGATQPLSTFLKSPFVTKCSTNLALCLGYCYALLGRLDFFRLSLKLAKWSLVVIFLVTMSGFFALHLVLSNQPFVIAPYVLSHDERKRAKAIFKQLKTSQKPVELLMLSGNDLNSGINYLCNRYILSGIDVAVVNETLHFTVTLVLPENGIGRYLNIRFALNYPYQLNNLSGLQIENITVSDKVMPLLLNKLIHYRSFSHYYLLIKQHIAGIRVEENQVIISYLPHPLFPLTKERQAIEFYQNQIVQLLNTLPNNESLSLTSLLKPLFKIAYQRSTAQTALRENKIVMMALNEYINRKELQRYLPFALPFSASSNYTVRFYGRTDLPKHFATSAVLAMTSNSAVAFALGVEKELRDRDAKHGSGFSFVDLASDKAGIKFGQSAIANLQSARQFQLKVLRLENDAAFIPAIENLPENLHTDDFMAQFESLNSAAYQAIVDDIDTRVAQLPFYQTP